MSIMRIFTEKDVPDALDQVNAGQEYKIHTPEGQTITVIRNESIYVVSHSDNDSPVGNVPYEVLRILLRSMAITNSLLVVEQNG